MSAAFALCQVTCQEQRRDDIPTISFAHFLIHRGSKRIEKNKQGLKWLRIRIWIFIYKGLFRVRNAGPTFRRVCLKYAPLLVHPGQHLAFRPDPLPYPYPMMKIEVCGLFRSTAWGLETRLALGASNALGGGGRDQEGENTGKGRCQDVQTLAESLLANSHPHPHQCLQQGLSTLTRHAPFLV